MKKLRISCLVLALGIVNAMYGGLIVADPDTPTDLTAFGFGVIPPVLTLQQSTMEQGCVVPVENVTCSTVAGWSSFTPITGEVSGEKKYTSPTVGELGITSWADLGILFNINEPLDTTQALTLQDLRLGLFNAQGTLVWEFQLEGEPIDFSNITPGQGGAGFLITISPAQQDDTPFNASLIIGMAAEIGCVGTPCQVPGNFATAGGAESFTVVSQLNPPEADPVPEPATLLLMGGGLATLGLVRFRRKTV